MPDLDRIHAAIGRAIEDANQRLPANKRIEASPEAEIVGDSAKLDSLGFITLLVAVEQEIEKEFQVSINLVSDVDQLMEEVEAFRTVSTLARRVSVLMADAEGDLQVSI